MDILLTGSVAYDYLMTFPGLFKQQILPERLEKITCRSCGFHVTPARGIARILPIHGLAG